MKPTIIAIIIGISLVGGAYILSQNRSNTTEPQPENNIMTVDGKQIVTILAKGGYSPKFSRAKADIPTILRLETAGTFDCSSALSLPTINYQKNLPPSGVTEIELPPQKAGNTFEGHCAMGMYEFKIAFE